MQPRLRANVPSRSPQASPQSSPRGGLEGAGRSEALPERSASRDANQRAHFDERVFDELRNLFGVVQTIESRCQPGQDRRVVDELQKLTGLVENMERRLNSSIGAAAAAPSETPLLAAMKAIAEKVDVMEASLQESRSEMVSVSAKVSAQNVSIKEVQQKMEVVPTLDRLLEALPSKEASPSMQASPSFGSGKEAVAYEMAVQTTDGSLAEPAAARRQSQGQRGSFRGSKRPSGRPSDGQEPEPAQAAHGSHGLAHMGLEAAQKGAHLGLDVAQKGAHLGLDVAHKGAHLGHDAAQMGIGAANRVANFMMESPGNKEEEEEEIYRSKWRKDREDEVLAISASLFAPERKKTIRFKKHADCVTRIGHAVWFKMLCTFVVLANVALVGHETNMRVEYIVGTQLCMENSAPPPAHIEDMLFALDITEWVVLGWMMLELAINVWTAGGFFQEDSAWNWFDLIILLISTIQLGLKAMNMSFLRIFRLIKFIRLLRLAKVMKVLRVVRFLQGVRKMILSVVGSLTSLFWALFLMYFIMFIVSIIIMQGIEIHFENLIDVANATEKSECSNGPMGIWNGTTPRTLSIESPLFEVDTWDSRAVQVRKLYGSVITTMVTLFGAISGGSDWAVVAHPVGAIHWIFDLLWLVFICIMIFGILNILTGIFVDAAMQAAQNDRHTIVQQELQDQQSATNTLRHAFQKCDTDNSGQLTEEEFDQLLEDDEVCAMLSHLGLHASEASGLFRLLDDDHSGRIGVDEFITGCIRLKGGAKEVDIITLMYQNKRLAKSLMTVADITEDILGKVEKIQERERLNEVRLQGGHGRAGRAVDGHPSVHFDDNVEEVGI